MKVVTSRPLDGRLLAGRFSVGASAGATAGRSVAGLIAGAVLTAGALSSCSPADDVASAARDHDAQASTASTAAREDDDARVLFIDCVGSPTSYPDTVTRDCSKPEDVVTDITWEQWTDERAVGEGTSTNGDDLEIKLLNPVDTGSDLVFSTVLVDGEIVAS